MAKIPPKWWFLLLSDMSMFQIHYSWRDISFFLCFGISPGFSYTRHQWVNIIVTDDTCCGFGKNGGWQHHIDLWCSVQYRQASACVEGRYYMRRNITVTTQITDNFLPFLPQHFRLTAENYQRFAPTGRLKGVSNTESYPCYDIIMNSCVMCEERHVPWDIP